MNQPVQQNQALVMPALANAAPPAYLTNMSAAQSQQMQDMAGGLAGRSKNVISIMGNRFTKKKQDGTDTPVLQVDQITGALYMDIAVFCAVPTVSRRFWAQTYSSENSGPPTCFSIDGKSPTGPESSRVHTSCDACPNNQVGSAITADNRKARACGYFKRIGVVDLTEPNVLYSMDLSSMSIFGKEVHPQLGAKFGMYVNHILNSGLNPAGVITRMYIMPGQQSPSLTFTAMGYLEEAQFSFINENITQEMRDAALAFNEEQAGVQSDGDAHLQSPATQAALPDQSAQAVQQPAMQQAQPAVQQQMAPAATQQPPVQQQVQQPAMQQAAPAATQMPPVAAQQPVQQQMPPVQQQVQQPAMQQAQPAVQQQMPPVQQQVQQPAMQQAAPVQQQAAGAGLPDELTGILDEIAGQ